MTKILSKTAYLSCLQCPRLFWTRINQKDRLPAVDEATQAMFDQGHQVGELAKQLYPDGIEIDWNLGFKQVCEKSHELLPKRKPLFEPGYIYNHCFTRADILLPVGDNQWDIIEVKSSTGAKDEHIKDLAFQHYVYSGNNIKIRKMFIMHVNNHYIKNGEIDVENFFSLTELTEEAETRSILIADEIPSFFDIVDVSETKIKDYITIGTQCKSPYPCILYDDCHSHLPEDNLLSLYRFNKRTAYELINQGQEQIINLSLNIELTERQQIQKEALKSGDVHINKPEIDKFLKQIEYPAYYLDFETINPAIPLFNGMRPYQMLPFQFSLHIQHEPNGILEHHSFLAEAVDDPRPMFMSKLKELIGSTGSVIVYNQTFEESRMKECAEAYPEYKEFVNDVNSRLLDLLMPFRNFCYYNPAQKGSASIKKVLPAIVGKSYEGMEIADGGTASREYFRVTFTDNNQDKNKVRSNLEEYCALDTIAMVDIISKLQNI